MAKKFYITAAIPYVNAAPHIGHALEFVETDAIARYHKLLGEEVLSLSGADENAVKNVQAAEALGVEIQGFVDKNSDAFLQLSKRLGVNFDRWQKGSDRINHFSSSQKLWDLCSNNLNEDGESDIYKKSYEGLYCTGCEAFYPPEELDEKGECFEHPGKKLETVREENYFFRLSRYQQQLIDYVETDKLRVIPGTRKNEVLSFLRNNQLQDISVSRTNERAKNWGVPVPGDLNQRIYVWFDALNIYQSGIGFNWNSEEYNKWWPADMHVIGKGIIRFHAVYWPAFLLSAKLQLPKSIFVHGYFTVNGQKMSKTTGNIVDPNSLIEKYGAEALRYYLLAKFPPFSDGDFSEEKLRVSYNAELANGLGNLVARILSMAEKYFNGKVPEYKDDFSKHPLQIIEKDIWKKYDEAFKIYKFEDALASVWELITACDRYIDDNKPWEIAKNEETEKLSIVIYALLGTIKDIAWFIYPFMPETAKKIGGALSCDGLTGDNPLFEESFKEIESGTLVKTIPPLFPRIQ